MAYEWTEFNKTEQNSKKNGEMFILSYILDLQS